MTESYIKQNGKLVKKIEDDQDVISVPELRNQLEQVDGNPQVKAILESIIDYLESEG